MLKLLNFFLIIIALVGLGYVTFCVSFGDKTLYEHMVGISETDEAKKLEGEIEKKVQNAADDISEKLKKQAAELAEAKKKALLRANDGDTETSKAEHSDEEKEELKSVIHQAAEPDAEDKQALDKLIKDKSSKTN